MGTRTGSSSSIDGPLFADASSTKKAKLVHKVGLGKIWNCGLDMENEIQSGSIQINIVKLGIVT